MTEIELVVRVITEEIRKAERDAKEHLLNGDRREYATAHDVAAALKRVLKRLVEDE